MPRHFINFFYQHVQSLPLFIDECDYFEFLLVLAHMNLRQDECLSVIVPMTRSGANFDIARDLIKGYHLGAGEMTRTAELIHAIAQFVALYDSEEMPILLCHRCDGELAVFVRKEYI